MMRPRITLPAEAYAVALPAAVILAAASPRLEFASAPPLAAGLARSAQGLGSGAATLALAFAASAVLVFVIWLTLRLGLVLSRGGAGGDDERPLARQFLSVAALAASTAWRNRRGFALFAVVLGSTLAMMAAIPPVLFSTADPARVAEVSRTYMEADRALFGAYPPFASQALQRFPRLDFLATESYFLLSALIFAAAVASVLRDGLLRKYLLAFFLSIAFSYPFWLAWPAISPQEMYRRDILSADIGPEMRAYVDSHRPSERVSRALTELDRTWIDPEGRLLSVSTNPSMHVAWSVLVMYVAWRLHRLLFAALAPWFIFNALGTVYLLQHYAVDVVGGLAVGLASLAVAGLLLRLERKRRPGDASEFYSA